MNKLKVEKYNLDATLLGGQSFSWDLIGESYYGFTQARAIKLRQAGENLFWQTYPKRNDEEFMRKYLRLETDYSEILSAINKDEHMKRAIEQNPNLRLLRQDFEQTLFSFILSTNRSIKSVRTAVRKLARKLGEKVVVENDTFYLFPKTEVLAFAPLEDLLSCGIGYRAGYLRKTAQSLLESGLSREIMNYKEGTARKILLWLAGVGPKVADCVLCFSLGFDTVTPVDVWGKRVLNSLYGLNPDLKYDEMRNWFKDYFDKYTSWAGQFLFEYIRSEKIETNGSWRDPRGFSPGMKPRKF
ncbi:MAG: DNA glycosylase [Candidatus Dojkabacteria bacterium]|nr:DNA glycosylase [Candidatus Dojkabacteria bacterium]